MCKRKKKMTPEKRTARSHGIKSFVLASYGCEKIEDIPVIQKGWDNLKFPLSKESGDEK